VRADAQPSRSRSSEKSCDFYLFSLSRARVASWPRNLKIRIFASLCNPADRASARARISFRWTMDRRRESSRSTFGIGKLMERSHATLTTRRSEFANEKARIGRRPFDLPSSRRATPMYVIGCRHRELLIASSRTSSLRSDDFAIPVRLEIGVKNNKRDARDASRKIVGSDPRARNARAKCSPG